MPRLLLNDELWSKLKKILLQQCIYNKHNLRLSVTAMLYRLRVDCLWRGLPKALGRWNSIYKRLNAWSACEKWSVVFKAQVAGCRVDLSMAAMSRRISIVLE